MVQGAQAASDEFFAVLDNATPSEQFVKTNSTSGKLGIGASFAFAITENDVIAKVDGGALFSGTDNLTVTAAQISNTQSEALFRQWRYRLGACGGYFSRAQ